MARKRAILPAFREKIVFHGRERTITIQWRFGEVVTYRLPRYHGKHRKYGGQEGMKCHLRSVIEEYRIPQDESKDH